MKERAQELKAGARRGRRADKADGEGDVLAKIAAMHEPDRAMAERLHTIIKASAPVLAPKTWYGMPVYAKDGKVVCFFQSGVIRIGVLTPHAAIGPEEEFPAMAPGLVVTRHVPDGVRDDPETRADIVSVMANDPFKALAHPIRRGIVERLARGPATIGEATDGFGVSKPTISRHVKVLEKEGVVVRSVEGRTHRLGLDLEALAEAVGWIDRQRAIWERMFDVVEDYLEEQKETR